MASDWEVGVLTLLDLSAAFNIVDQSDLMDVLRRQFGIQGSAPDWLADYLTDRSQVVDAGVSNSKEMNV